MTLLPPSALVGLSVRWWGYLLRVFLVFSSPKAYRLRPCCMLLRGQNQVLGSLMGPFQNEITSNRTNLIDVTQHPTSNWIPARDVLDLFCLPPRLFLRLPLSPFLHDGCSDAAHPVSWRGARGGTVENGHPAPWSRFDSRPGLHACSCL